MHSSKTQCDRILSLLQRGGWIPLPEILKLMIASHTRRIHELRKQGWIIDISAEEVNGQKRTMYKLMGKRKLLDELEMEARQ